MLRSLFSGISGLKAHQQMMDVVSNNISNVNTIGFKSSNVVFEDTLSQLMRASSAATSTTGGLNPTQIGLGVQLGSVQNNFLQGSTQTTNKATDLMIQGDGFFVLQDGNSQVYSRAGAFTLDTNGDLVNPNGMYALGYAATGGVVNSFGALSKISMPAGTSIPGSATTLVNLGGNLSPTGTTTLTLTPTVYNINGAATALAITLVPHSPPDGIYDVNVLDPTDPTGATILASGVAAFDAAGVFDPTASTSPINVTVNGSVMDVDLSGFTGYSGTNSPVVTKTDGYTAGTLTQFQIGDDGVVTGVFSNSQKQALGQLALATFNNPSGLEKLGDSVYRSSANSGLAEVGVAGSGGRGSLVSGALEMSNVDLALEFTNMIIAQRGFSANSKVITASDEMLQDLVNIKR
jgi:flagellar hook protein FlgE